MYVLPWVIFVFYNREQKVKVMRNRERLDDNGVGRSFGYGFVEYDRHDDALVALRAVNNNPALFSATKRPIVEFAIDDVRALRKKELRRDQVKAKQARTKATENGAKGATGTDRESSESKSQKRRKRKLDKDEHEGVKKAKKATPAKASESSGGSGRDSKAGGAKVDTNRSDRTPGTSGRERAEKTKMPAKRTREAEEAGSPPPAKKQKMKPKMSKSAHIAKEAEEENRLESLISKYKTKIATGSSSWN